MIINMYDIIQPKERISKDAIKVWGITSAIVDSIGIIIAGSLLWLSYQFEWANWLKVTFLIATIILALFTIGIVSIRPKLLYKYWQYGHDEREDKFRYVNI